MTKKGQLVQLPQITNWGALDHASHAPQLKMSCNYYVCVCTHVNNIMCAACIHACAISCMHGNKLKISDSSMHACLFNVLLLANVVSVMVAVLLMLADVDIESESDVVSA